ncbi:MAG: hydrogenase maturation protease [Campylobacteraceae bacterium]|nr:hydrogenase maturation protease [Campylobacteraceae bacterium]
MKKAMLMVGNPLRGDDGITTYLGGLLEEQNTHWKIFYGDDVPEREFHRIREYAPDLLVVCDATTGSKIGSVDFIDLSDDKDYMYATHNIPMPVLISYLRGFCKHVLFLGLNIDIVNTLDISEQISEEAKSTALRAVEKIKEIDEIFK